MKTTHLRLTLLKDMVTIVPSITEAGRATIWRVLKRFKDGDWLIERGGQRSILTKQEVKSREVHREPSFGTPGLVFRV